MITNINEINENTFYVVDKTPGSGILNVVYVSEIVSYNYDLDGLTAYVTKIMFMYETNERSEYRFEISMESAKEFICIDREDWVELDDLLEEDKLILDACKANLVSCSNLWNII